MTVPKGQANYLVHGRRLSAWQVRRRYGTRDRIRIFKLDPDLQIELLPPKHRYVFVSAPRIQERRILGKLTARGLPYPRRLGEAVAVGTPESLADLIGMTRPCGRCGKPPVSEKMPGQFLSAHMCSTQ